jgi:Helix-turn-helix domain of resolvase
MPAYFGRLDIRQRHASYGHAREVDDVEGVVRLPLRPRGQLSRSVFLSRMGKVAGVYKGRPPSIEAARVRELKAQGMRPTDIAKALKIGRASVYRLLES